MEQLVRVENGVIVVAEEYLQEFGEYLITKAQFEMKEKEFKEALQVAMEENGIKSYENNLMKVTYVGETTRKTLDSKALKEQAPDVYEAFVKESLVKACLKIAIK